MATDENVTIDSFPSFALRLGHLNTNRTRWYMRLTGVYCHLFGNMRSIKSTHVYGRYDLNALFAKEFGNFTVNVQGLSRVSYQ